MHDNPVKRNGGRESVTKCKGERDKALFYVRRTIQNGWSRNSLLNWLSTDLYEREGEWSSAA